MISCERAWELLNLQLDGALSPQEEQELEEHLASCPACRKDQEELAQMSQALRGLGEVQVPADFTQRVMEQVRAESQEKPKVISLQRRRWARTLMGLAACALLCIGIYRVIPQGSNLRSGMVTDGQAAVSAQQPQTSERSVDEDVTNSGQQPAQTPDDQETAQPPAAQPRTADLAPDVPDQSGTQSGGETEQPTPYAAEENGESEYEVQNKAQTPEVTTASTQTVLVLRTLPTGASALLPTLDEWEADREGNVSCTVTRQVLEQLCQLLDQAGTEYTVTPEPWSETCIVRLG